MAQTFTHPGVILREDFLIPLGIAPSAFADRLGLPPNRITGIVNGTRSVTAETALLLAQALGTSAELWLNLQQNFDVARARTSMTAQDAARLKKAQAFQEELMPHA